MMQLRFPVSAGMALVLLACRPVSPSPQPSPHAGPAVATAARHSGAAPGGARSVRLTAAALASLPISQQACGVPTDGTGSLADQPAGDALAVFDTAWTIIRRTHWDTTYNGVDWMALRDSLRPRAAAARTRGELRAVLSTMVGSLRQSHFSIIPQETAEATSGGSAAQEPSRGGPSGSLGFEARLIDGAMVVSRIDTGGPAWQAGVRTGWTVNAIRGCPIAPRLAQIPRSLEPRRIALMAAQMVSRELNGLEGDSVAVEFLDGTDAPRPLTLVQGPMPGTIVKFGNLPPMDAHLTWQRLRQGGRTIGVIRFNVWMPVIGTAFDIAMDSLRGSDAIVLDLRGNLGGVGGMAMGISGHFLDSAITIGTMTQRRSTVKFVANPRVVSRANEPVRPFAGPLAIVVDPLSASTTEIFVAGLQELGRATVFGTQSAGQALPSVPERLPNGDILYHAIADFVGPTGKPVEGDGVLPHRVISPERRALLAGRDPALDAAIAWAAQPPARSVVP